MSKDILAIKWISKHLGYPITLDHVGYESYVFDGDEIDSFLIPDDYIMYFKANQPVMTHLYAYDDVMVYFLEPLQTKYADKTLIGLLDDFRLIRYELFKGDI